VTPITIPPRIVLGDQPILDPDLSTPGGGLDQNWVRFDGDSLANARVDGQSMNGATLDGCDAEGAQFADCDMANLRTPRTTFPSASFDRCDLESADLRHLSRDEEAAYLRWERTVFRDCRLHDADARGEKFLNTGFEDTDMTSIQMDEAEMGDAYIVRSNGDDLCAVRGSWTDVTMEDSTARGANLNACLVTRPNWVRTSFLNSAFYEAQFLGGGVDECDFSQARMRSVIFTDTLGRGNMFTGADLRGSLFTDTGLHGDYRGCDFTMAVLRDCDFNDSAFSHATLTGVDARRCTFNRITAANTRLQGEFSCCDFKGAVLHNADLSGTFDHCDFDGADLRGADLNGAQFDSCIMFDAIVFASQIPNPEDPMWVHADIRDDDEARAMNGEWDDDGLPDAPHTTPTGDVNVRAHLMTTATGNTVVRQAHIRHTH